MFTPINDLSLVCIVCLKNERSFSSIYYKDEHTPELKIVDKIASCTRLQFKKYSLCKVKLPDRICNSCLHELNNTWKFLRKCDAAVKVFEALKVAAAGGPRADGLHVELDKNDDSVEVEKCQKLRLPPSLKVKRVTPCSNRKFGCKLPDVISINADTEEGIDPKLLSRLDVGTETRAAKNVRKPNQISSYMQLNEITVNDDGDVDDEDVAGDDDNSNDNIEYIGLDGETAGEEIAQYQFLDATDSDIRDDNDDGEKLHPFIRIAMTETYSEERSFPPADSEDHAKKTIRKKRSSTLNKHNAPTLTNATGSRRRSNQNVSSAAASSSQKTKRNKNTDTSNGGTNNSHTRTSNTGDSSNSSTSSTSANKRKAHESTTKRPPKICQICGNIYRYQHTLNAHMRRHNNDRPYGCEVCNKAFISNVELRRHMRVHTGQKPYACKYCDRRFSDFGSSKKHERIHTGERPYVCDVCEKGFAYAHVLSVHKRTHTGLKQFQCNQCHKGFTKKAYLQTHLQTHRHAADMHALGSATTTTTTTTNHNNNNNTNLRIHHRDGRNNLNGDCDGESNNAGNDGAKYLSDVCDESLVGVSLIDDSGTISTAITVAGFEEGRVLEECVVTSEFMADGVDSPSFGRNDDVSDREVDDSQPTYTSTVDFLDDDHLTAKYSIQ